MKRLAVILLFILYGTASMGMTVHFHYCCGKLDKVDLNPTEPKHCKAGKAKNMGNKPCCDNKEVSLSIKQDQSSEKVYQTSFNTHIYKPVYPSFLVTSPAISKNLLPEVFAPPPSNNDLMHLLCIYRI